MNSSIENIIKKYVRKVILPHYGFEYDEVNFDFKPPFKDINNNGFVAINFHINPYKVFKNAYNEEIFYTWKNLSSDLRTLDVAFNVNSSYYFEPDSELEMKFKKEYVPKFKKILQENGIYDVDVDFGWNDETTEYEFLIRDEETDNNIKEKILKIFEKFRGKSTIKLYFGLE